MTYSTLSDANALPRELHGHEVIAFMRSLGDALEVAAWITAIETHFGAGTRYYTCTACNMDAAELLAFLMLHRKLVPKGAGLVIEPASVCDA